MKVEHVKIESVSLDPNNARGHEKGIPELANSLAKFGQQKPIVVWHGTVIAGNGTVQAAIALGWTHIDIVRAPEDWDYDTARAFALADNKTAELSEWKLPVLEQTMLELDGNGWDLESFGFDPLPTLVNFGDADPDDVPDVPEVPKTKFGDLWQLGEHFVLCGDSTKAESYERLMGGGVADMVFTDPPYGVSYADKNVFLNVVAPANRIEEEIEGDHQTPAEMSEFWKEAFGCLRLSLRPGGSYYVTGPQGGDLLLLLLLALTESGFPLRHMLIWVKNNFVLGRSDYNYQHEPILYGWVKGSHKFYGGGGSTSVWEIDKPHSSKLHPTMKPVELMTRCIENSTKPANVVIDPFGGSGSTLIACEQIGRKCRMIEIDPRYVDVIVKRWETLTGKKAKRLPK